MNYNRQLLKFVATFVVMYAVFVFPWPGVKSLYNAYYRTVGNILYSQNQSPNCKIRVEKLEPPQGQHDIKIVAVNNSIDNLDGQIKPVTLGILNSRQAGYTSMAVLLSLILATPIQWRRRGIAAAIGLVLINIFISLNLAIYIEKMLIDYAGNLQLHVSGLWTRVILFLNRLIENNITLIYFLPILIWILLCFRADDWKKFRLLFADGSPLRKETQQ